MMKVNISVSCLTVLLFILIGCSSVSKLRKAGPRATVNYTKDELSAQQKATQPADTATQKAGDPIVYTHADGTQELLLPSVQDTAKGENIAMVQLETVTITGGSTHRVAERKGKINISFMVVAPGELQRSAWQVNLQPMLRRDNGQTDSLQAIQLSGAAFRAKQHRDYAEYDEYLGRIIPDSADFFHSFVNTKGFYNYLDRLEKQRIELTHRLSRPGRSVDDILMRRFMLFNARGIEMDSARQRRVARQQQLILHRKQTAMYAAQKQMQPVTKMNSSLLAMRFSLFNARLEGMKSNYSAKRQTDSTEVSGFPLRYFERDIPPPTWVREPSGYDRFRMKAAGHFSDPLLQKSRHHLGMGWMRAMLCVRDTAGLRRRTEGYNLRQKLMIEAQLRDIAAQDSTDVVKNFVEKRKIALNEKLKAEKDVMRGKIIPFPLREDLRLDSVVHRSDTLFYHYAQELDADENTSKLWVYLDGNIINRSGVFYTLPASDTLHYNVSSMTNFIDTVPRYVKRILFRDAQANASLLIAFPRNKSQLRENFENNAAELGKMKEIVADLMTDPIYIINGITLTAASSPEGHLHINKRFSEERSQAVGEYLKTQIDILQDSLFVGTAITINEDGTTTIDKKDGGLDLKGKVKIKSVAENWSKLTTLLEQGDGKVKYRQKIVDMINTIADQDRREYAIRRVYPGDYAEIREKLYPKLRTVDIQFDLQRRGMLQDTIHTMEIDTVYAEGVQLLQARKYHRALEILRPYEDVNTALAYMSLGLDVAALRIFAKHPNPTDNILYTMAILYARQEDETHAVQSLMRAVELNPRLRFRGNLDPEISDLMKKYNLFEEDM